MNQAELPERLTVREVAAFCRVSEDCVTLWIRSGKLPGYRFRGGRVWLVRREDLLSRIEADAPAR